MTANELRIGNLVNYNNLANSVRGIDETYIELFDNTYAYIDNIKPIPLTEEWLIKFGFIKNHKAFVTYERVLDYNTSLTLFKDHEDGVYSMVVILTQQLDEEDYQEIVLENTSFVHQLQNLYFTLTGKELKIK